MDSIFITLQEETAALLTKLKSNGGEAVSEMLFELFAKWRLNLSGDWPPQQGVFAPQSR
jgi:predicted CopG family antitoxin